MTEAPAVTPAVRAVTTLAVVAVAIVAAVVSFEHMRQLALSAGEGWRSWLIPVSVDGLMVAASMTALTRRRAGQDVGVLAWCALLLGIAASVTANVAAAEPTVIGRAVAAWPPLALGLSFELLLQQGRRSADVAPPPVAPKIEVALARATEPVAEAPTRAPKQNGDRTSAARKLLKADPTLSRRAFIDAMRSQGYPMGTETARKLMEQFT